MKTVHISQLSPSPKLFACLKAAQMEAAKVWNQCCQIHKQARMEHAKWPGRNDLQKATKGQFILHSQSVQMVVHAFLATIDATRELRKTHPQNMRHKATRSIIAFCQEQKVGKLFIGNPHGVRNRESGRHHNQRMALWEYGKDIDYLTHKSKQAHIMSFTGSERGTSSQCPACGHKHKPKGRNWACKACGFTGHRDIVGSANMHPLAFDEHIMFPRSVIYLRPGKSRRSSRAGVPLAPSGACCLSQSPDQPLLYEQVSSETGHTVEVAQKLIPFLEIESRHLTLPASEDLYLEVRG